MAELLSQGHEVEVIHGGKGYSLSGLADAFDVDLSQAKERIVEDSLVSFSRPIRSYLREGLKAERALTEPYDLFIYSGHGVPPFCYARQGLIYCLFPFEGRPPYGLDDTERWKKRHPLDRRVRLALFERVWERRMRGYGTVLADSRFTAEWIRRLWGKEAEVVYPPVVAEIPPAEKRNVIVSVGRFVATDRKNLTQQLEALPAFLSRIHGDWSLRMIGFCTDLPQDRAYVERLQKLAKDLPATFVVNADRKTVLSHLSEAKLFWHTTGLGEEGSIEPRYMEHFGIATVEAMMAGCVPIVPACGGQPEIVEHEVSGFLCHDLEALVWHSALLANDERLRAQMSCQAIGRSGGFRQAIFEERFGEQVLRCVGKRDGKAGSWRQ
jgi:glycosyltransferase involved in cell wall biosynthesis